MEAQAERKTFLRKLVFLGISLVIISLSFTNAWELPYVAHRIQLTEVIFFLLGILFLVWCKSFGFNTPIRNYLDRNILIFGVVFGIAFFFSFSPGSYFEVIGLWYLITLYFLLTYFLRENLIPNLSHFVVRAFSISGVIAALIGICGWVLTQFGIVTTLAWPVEVYYPYLGHIGRASGFATTPNMLMSFLSVCVLLKVSEVFGKKKTSRKDLLVLLILFAGIVFTLSKEMVLLFAGLLLIWWIYNKKTSKKYFNLIPALLIPSCIFLHLFFTNIMIVEKAKPNWELLRTGSFALDTPFAEVQDYNLVWTSYAVIKKTTLLVFSRYPFFGVGAGKFKSYQSSLKTEGLYPTYFFDFDPHSTYLGILAENGLFVFLFMLFLFFTIGKAILFLLKNVQPSNKHLAIGLAACFFVAALEGISTDNLHFRHYWVLLAILGALIEFPDRE